MGIAFAIGKFLLGGFQWLAIVAQCIMDFVKRNPWQAACIILACLSFWLWNGKRHVSAKLTDEKAAHALTVTNYREASKRSQAAAKVNVARVKKEQEQINERHVEALEERLAVGQSRYDRLRAQSEAHSRSSSQVGMSATSEAACQAHAGTACEAIPALLKAAQDNTDMLVELQVWAKEQGDVEVAAPNP